HPWSADAGGAATPAVPGRSLPLLPRADPRDGARGGPVVGRGDSPSPEVPEPVPDDLGLRAEVPAGGAHPLHEHARQAEGPLRVRPSRAVVRALPPGSRGAALARGRARGLPARQCAARVPVGHAAFTLVAAGSRPADSGDIPESKANAA